MLFIYSGFAINNPQIPVAKQNSPTKKINWKKELIEWSLIFTVIAGLYISGLHTEVIGRLQSLLLYSRVIQPHADESDHLKPAMYDMPLITFSGEQLSLSQFKNKTIFLNFWATWCPPCIAEMPNIQSLFDDIASDSIIFVMVSLDEDKEKARKFIQKKEYTFPVYLLAGRQPGVYNSTTIPTTYIISPDGEIVSEHRGMALYNTAGFKNFLLSL